MRVCVSPRLLSLAAVSCGVLLSAPLARAGIYLEAIPGSLDDTRIEAATARTIDCRT
jgi:hypothetical protein